MTTQSTYAVLLSVPQKIQIPGEATSWLRDDFYGWLWNQFAEQGLVGVHEGTCLSDQLSADGKANYAWTLDIAEAPTSRDWVAEQEVEQAELYFTSEVAAKNAAAFLKNGLGLTVHSIQERKPQDWDAQWKASFLNAGQGVFVPPDWRVVPPWVKAGSHPERMIKINPGAGFGTGTHETTQLCLQAIGNYSKEFPLHDQRVLDFGSGSGILSIGMALLGAKVDAVEVDSLAIDNARENAQINQLEDQIRFFPSLPPLESDSCPAYRYVVANILKPVLLEFSNELVKRLQPGGILILSGLIDQDIEAIGERYSTLLKIPVLQKFLLGDWRCLVFLKPEF